MSLGNGTATRAQPLGAAPHARAAIVTALQGIDGVQAHATLPDTPVAFDAFPRWALTNYTGGRIGVLPVHEYDVLVVLPAGYEPDTVHQGDVLLETIATALAQVGTVRQADPVQLALQNGSGLPALRVRVVPHLTTSGGDQSWPQVTPTSSGRAC